MNSKGPQDSDKYEWTEHSKYKMRQYGLSSQRVLRIIRSPKRIEEGIVEKTIAVMQPSSMKTDKDGKRTWGQEIWVMYQLRGASNQKTVKSNQENTKKKKSLIQNSKFKILNSVNRKIRIISAWRFPGVSDENSPIPDEIMREIEDII